MLRELSLQINDSRVFFNERPNLVTKSTLEGKKFYSYYCREIIFYFSAKATLVLSIPCTLCKDDTNNSKKKKNPVLCLKTNDSKTVFATCEIFFLDRLNKHPYKGVLCNCFLYGSITAIKKQ